MLSLGKLSLLVAVGSMVITGFAFLVPGAHPFGSGTTGVTGGLPPPHLTSPEMKRIMVLRVYFHDYAATSRFTQAQIDAIFNTNLNLLWQNTSYGHIGISGQVSALYQLPDNRADYITDHSTGDSSDGGQFDKVLNDAIANAPGGLDWTNLNAVMVIMVTTSSSDCHRGAEATRNLHMGPGGPTRDIAAAIFMENPCENFNQVWGRWAHESGHAFQVAGPAHPSNYNSEFELMDANYPGQSGVFEKQASMGFPSWLPPFKYLTFDPPSGGGIAVIWAEEYDPTLKPNVQAVKATITGSLYYLVSVRRRILSDDTNGDFTPFGIPDEGVLIERVTEGADQWVTVQGNPGRNNLWHQDQTYSNVGDGITIRVDKKVDNDSYAVSVRYGNNANQPDVGLYPWRSPPGDTWETTDIWIDSPANGYGTYRFGTWMDLSGNSVPRGNGDPPTVGLVNRVYARVRNFGTVTATNVHVHWEITDPMGVGINGANGFIPLGDTDQTVFPSLAALAPGAFADVYVDWTPSVDVSETDLTDGLFHFHTCLRVILDHVAGETTFGNQDGNEEQENIDLFAATPSSEGGVHPAFNATIHLRNDDVLNSKYFYLTYNRTVPAGWNVDVNGGILGLQLAPDELKDIPITITPVGPDPPVGSIFGLDVEASSVREFVNDLNASDVHTDFEPLGGVHVEVRIVHKADLVAITSKTPNGVHVVGTLGFVDYSGLFDPANPFQIMVVGVDANRHFIANLSLLLAADVNGHFEGTLPATDPALVEVAILFVGTDLVGSASTGYLPLQSNVTASLKLTPRTLNLKSQGSWVTAHLAFDDAVANLLDPTSILLAGTIAADRVQVLGAMTLLIKFDRAALIAILSPGMVTLCVTGKLMDGRMFKACDTIRVIRPGP
ncbi:MAG: hypothetical protein E6K18_04985 [Methanobacteriota archaeon]|nr:MAG: hypothetical protein E6K18_04985 [Euryarchaeota archaeon]